MTRKIIRDQKIVDDDWVQLGDDEAAPAQGRIIVSLERWQRERADLLKRADDIGVALPNTVDVEELFDESPHWQLIALEFPAFTDGRAYTQARLLRGRGEFGGELRATGDVLRDQLYYMYRCGFDSFELAAGHKLEDALNGFQDFSQPYQPSARGGQAMFRHRAATR